jgi:DNA polymerase III epsilon subunit-like protein
MSIEMKEPKLIIVFDVETNGLIPKKNSMSISQNINNPYILQLSFIVYDVANMIENRVFNSYVNVDDSVMISPKITELTGITREKCKSLGNPIEDVLIEFYKEYERCDVIVAHNISFDREMINIEILRNHSKMTELGYVRPEIIFNNTYNHIHNKYLFCTMLHGKSTCNIIVETSKRSYIKFPKLSELYFKLFGEVPEGLHDALVDTRVCLKCYLDLNSKNVIV